MVDDDAGPTPAVVTGSVSIGTAPLPFIAVYAALFLLHGAVHPVHPPDIGNSQDQELVAGLITAAIFVLATASLVMFLNRSRRWFYAIIQLVVLAGCVDVLADSTKGGRPIAVLLVLTTVVSLALGFAPDSWTHVGRVCPGWLATSYERLGLRTAGGTRANEPRATDPRVTVPAAALPQSTPPSSVEPATLRRRRFPGRSTDRS